MILHHSNTLSQNQLWRLEKLMKYPIFDGHNDTILNLYLKERGKERSFFEKSEHGHIDLPRAKEGGLAAGFFATHTV